MNPQVVARTNLEAVRSKAKYFEEVGLWPAPPELDAVAWLNNFSSGSDIVHAAHLLNAVMYFNDTLLGMLLEAAVQGIGARIAQNTDWTAAQACWSHTVDAFVVVVLPSKNDADTRRGQTLTRLAEGLVIEPSRQVVTLDELRATISQVPRESHIVVVDDFLGDLPSLDGRADILSSLTSAAPGRVVYCPALAYENGVRSLTRTIQDLFVSTAHILPSKYSATDPDSVVWPESLRPTAQDFLRNASSAAGISADWVSASCPALALSFSYRTTAVTIPLFLRATQTHWRPLLQPSKT